MMDLRRYGSALASVLLLVACHEGTTAPAVDRMVEVTPGAAAACGILDNGRLLCWGEDHTGSLGDGSATSHADPRPVDTKVQFTQVTLGGLHTCGLASDGRAWCWGDNTRSQLGVVTTDLECLLPAVVPTGFYEDHGNDCSTRPVPVETSLRFRQIGAGRLQTCGVTTGHEIWCWGSSEIGNSAEWWTSATPIQVVAPIGFKSLAVTWDHACAIDTDDLGWCWGENWTGALGDGTQSYRLQPVRIGSSATLARVAVGLYHSCAVTKQGGALCWGRNSSGQLGDSTVTERLVPSAVVGTRKFSAIAASSVATCALEQGNGAAWCWGENSAGGLGDGTLLDRRAPSRVLGGLGFDRIAMATDLPFYSDPLLAEVYATSAGEVYAWGPLPRPLTFEE